MIAILIVIVFTRAPISPTIALLPLGFVYLFLFCIGVSLIMSIVAAYFRDMLHLYPLLMLALMYLTPIFYSVDAVSPRIKGFVQLNPLYWYITYFREVIMWGTIPAMRENLVCLAWGVGVLILGLIFFKKQQDDIILHI
jgi:ABC-2 type transport system permease protein